MTQIYTRSLTPHLHKRSSSYKQSYSTGDFQFSNLHHSEDQYEGDGWKLSQPHSLMSSQNRGIHEIPPPKVGDVYQIRPEISQNPAREQLPPLSSLFGATQHSRPAQSPYLDRQSPVFPALSPQDPRQSAAPYDGPYFQRPAPSRQYPSYSSTKLESVEKLGFQPPPRPNQVASRSESPRYEPRFAHAEIPRPQQASSVHSWSPRSEAARLDYFPRDTSSSFRPHSENRLSQSLRPETDPRPTYRGASQTVPATFPPPPSIVTGDPNSKDGLGPKIWTGTQFLPRFVRQAEVPGEGLCYFYDDGTHCKTVIDGEVVNAHWGVTKAGKPRKRLAIACITCREKKIKCDPDYPSPRGGQGSPDTPPADPEDLISSGSNRTEVDSFKLEKREGSRSVSPRQTLRQSTPDLDIHPAKRQRIGYNSFTPVASEASPRPSIPEAISPSTPWVEPSTIRTIDHSIVRDWQINPFTTHPTLVTDLLSIFFRYHTETVYLMFPERAFSSWFLSTCEKSLDDLMLIYSILAMSTVFSSNPDHKSLGIQYAIIARYACDNRHFSLQLVQSRLVLATYYFALNNFNDSWDFCGSAFRAAAGLKLNLEIEKTDDIYLDKFPYGLNRFGYAECRRRTFWTCYILDRFNGFCAGNLSSLQAEDVFLKVPCDAKSFEDQSEVNNPIFNVGISATQNDSRTIDIMAYIIDITTIWGDVMAHAYRTSQRPCPASSVSSFYESSARRLREWKASLPPCYAFSPDSLTRASTSGTLAPYILMHAVYENTAMKLNRYGHASSLTTTERNHRVFQSKQHATTLVEMMDTVIKHRAVISAEKFATPYVGFAIVSAIDILTAKISVPFLPTLLPSFKSAQTIISELSCYWQSARNQQTLVLQRVRHLTELSAKKDGGVGVQGSNPLGENIGEGIFRVKDAIEKTFPRDYDCVYA
ncbi:hypothetical protein B7494_g5252 [Chlorociboria aeruginascens]|nr:hypothetical protein B7494_g5252 [Chlorociboria aeruginascens]